jgi:hypothetical protein
MEHTNFAYINRLVVDQSKCYLFVVGSVHNVTIAIGPFCRESLMFFM